MYCSASTFKGEIFAAGGVEDSTSHTSIERFDPRTGNWQIDRSLPRTMCGCGMQVLDSVPADQLHSSKRRYFDASFEAGAVASTASPGTEVGPAVEEEVHSIVNLVVSEFFLPNSVAQVPLRV
jgi:hypothetical protein